MHLPAGTTKNTHKLRVHSWGHWMPERERQRPERLETQPTCSCPGSGWCVSAAANEGIQAEPSDPLVQERDLGVQGKLDSKDPRGRPGRLR